MSENIYLKLIEDIINDSIEREDRTGVGTFSKFGVQLRFDLNKGFPLLTTKRLFWRGIVEELLWIISGKTNSNILKEKGIHIWDKNSSRENLDDLGFFNREEGDLGPIYGFQWRHFGAKYIDMNSDYNGKGIDQLKNVIELIKNEPNSRRIILTSWNPCDLNEMVLPPCHMMCQFFVIQGKLSCQLYQRSGDIGLGVPFNIASYSLLIHLIAKVCELEVGEFIYVIGDAHIYKNHIELLKQQIERKPRPFPDLLIKTENKDIDCFKFEDFEILNYDPYPPLKMDMAI